MNHKQVFTIGVSILLAVFAFGYGNIESKKSIRSLETTLTELKSIEFVTDSTKTVSTINNEISNAFKELGSLTKMVKLGLDQPAFRIVNVSWPYGNIGGGGGGANDDDGSSTYPSSNFPTPNEREDIFVNQIILANKEINKTALANTQEIQTALEKIKVESSKREQANTELISSFIILQTQYNKKIAELESQINFIKNEGSTKGLDFWGTILGLITGISTLFLAWRNDNREVKSLQIELAEYQANKSLQRKK